MIRFYYQIIVYFNNNIQSINKYNVYLDPDKNNL